MTPRAERRRRIGLGTAQLGLEYGITHDSGPPARSETRAILARAAMAGVEVVDTAPAYGESELRLGEDRPRGAPFRCVTKVSIDPTHPSAVAEQVRRSLSLSCERLRVDRLEAVLVHRSSDLLTEGATELGAALDAAVDDGLVGRWGASVYTIEEAEETAARFPVRIVQLPVSVLDQRALRDGRLARLSESGVEVHARSVFLQGLLLADPDAIPASVVAVRPALLAFREHVAARGWTPLEAALGFILAREEIDIAICGVTRVTELDEILAAAEQTVDAASFADLALEDTSILDPRRWEVPA